jgi:hypothetical protein
MRVEPARETDATVKRGWDKGGQNVGIDEYDQTKEGGERDRYTV